jgi:hypothetical protein
MLIKETADDAGEVRTVAIMLEGESIAVSFGHHKEFQHIEAGGRCHIWFSEEDGHITLSCASRHHTAALACSKGLWPFTVPYSDVVSINMA